jgi:TrmH family RNA methyltransferase
VQRVVSPHNPRLREALRLAASSRERRKAGRCVLEGVHLVDVYRERIGTPDMLIVTDEALAREDVRAVLARVPPARVIAVPARILAEHSAMPPEMGLLAVVPTPRVRPAHDARFTVLLDDLQDPGNVGSILRTAAAAGVEQVVLSKTCAFAWSPKVLRAGQGAHFLTAIAEDVDLVDWARRFAEHGGHVVATLARGGTDLYSARFAGPLAVAIGNEGAGISPELAAACDLRVTIPMASGESLNAAAAAAVVLFECVRQRRAASASATLRKS